MGVVSLIDEFAGFEFPGLAHNCLVLPILHRHMNTGNSQLRRRRLAASRLSVPPGLILQNYLAHVVTSRGRDCFDLLPRPSDVLVLSSKAKTSCDLG